MDSKQECCLKQLHTGTANVHVFLLGVSVSELHICSFNGSSSDHISIYPAIAVRIVIVINDRHRLHEGMSVIFESKQSNNNA